MTDNDTWSEAPASVIEIAQDLIAHYHISLLEARIGFIFRKEATRSQGRIIKKLTSSIS